MNIKELQSRFVKEYPESGQPFVLHAPGRVNIIGEHLDYNGLSVMPMAMQRGITLAFAGRPDPVIRLRNTDTRFEEAVFENSADIPRSEAGAWENYVKASVHGLNRAYGFQPTMGMDVLVTSTLPMQAGLASSSAFVVGAAMAYLAVCDRTLEKDVTRLALAEVLAEAERYVGTKGGGMDQTVILCADGAHACKIGFNPLRTEPVPVIEDHAFVVCDSLQRAAKSGAARLLFNAGPILSAVATALVQRQVQEEFDPELEIATLGDLFVGHLCLTHQEALALLNRAIPGERMHVGEIAGRLGMLPEEAAERWLGELPEPKDGYPVKARARHALTEFRRVEGARDAMHADDPAHLAQLMDESHTSCADDYGISTPELDALVAAARASGAVGARLTGAGFGGAVVSLVPRDALDVFTAGLHTRYYAERMEADAPLPVFVAEASPGAAFLNA
jgi:galactokinase